MKEFLIIGFTAIVMVAQFILIIGIMLVTIPLMIFGQIIYMIITLWTEGKVRLL